MSSIRGGARGDPNGRGRGRGIRGSITGTTRSGGHGKVNGIDAPAAPAAMSVRQGTARGRAPSRGGTGAQGDRARQNIKNALRGRGDHKMTASRSASPTTGPESSLNSTPFASHEYAKRLQYLRDERPRVREQLIQQGRMNPDGPMRIEDAVTKYGYCTEMCPEYERVRRIVENDVKAPECTPETAHASRPERVPDESRMVKAFTRSAAGTEDELVSEVRTPETCLKTLDYMFKRIAEDGLPFLYQWLWDRTRGIRKDLVGEIKFEDVPTYLTCVEQCTRFHLLTLHQMSGMSTPSYNHELDHGNDIEQLNNCYTSLRHRYEKNVTDQLESPNKAEFIAYDIVMELRFKKSHLESDLSRLDASTHQNEMVQTAIGLRDAGLNALSEKSETLTTKQQSWATFWALLQSPDITYLMACAAELSFKRIRHHVLKTILRAHRPRKTRKAIPMDDWSLEKLRSVMGFDDQKEVKEYCQMYGFEFTVNEQGFEFLDANSLPAGSLEEPPTLRAQLFSRTLVEPKRKGRSLLSIIQGNLGDDGRENTLFVPEQSPFPYSSLFHAATQSVPANGILEPSQDRRLNPFAPAFQPPAESPFNTTANGTSTKPNPFTKTNTINHQAPTTQPAFSSPFGQQPGLFNPAKDSIKFGAPFAENGNPFAKFAQNGAPSATQVPVTASKPAHAISLATAAANDSPFPTFQLGSGEDGLIGQVKTSWTSANPSGIQNPVVEDAPQNSASSNQAVNPIGSVPPPNPLSLSGLQTTTRVQEEAEAKEKQRLADEQQRLTRMEQQRAREREERRLHEAEVQRQIQKEEEERLRRLQEEAAIQARLEQERRIREEQACRARQEAARRAQEQKEQAFDRLTASLLNAPQDGLLAQFLDHTVVSMVNDVAEKLQDERMEQMAEELYQSKRLAFTRSVCARWLQLWQRKKARLAARQRRHQLKAFRNTIGSSLETNHLEVQPAQVAQLKGAHSVDSNANTLNTFKKPNLPSKVKGTANSSAVGTHNDSTSRIKERASPNKTIGTLRPGREVHAYSTSISAESDEYSPSSYSNAYQKSKAPVDRTETDWFKLRALGVDPSKHRKRSLNLMSSPESMEPEIELKRARHSTSSSMRGSLPPPRSDEERIARFRAIQVALEQGRAMSYSHDVSQPGINRSNSVTYKARGLFSNPSPPHLSTSVGPLRRSQSITDTHNSKPTPHLSTFCRTLGAAHPNEPLAYRNRPSRFIPSHLYGKGAEAVRAYRNEVYGRAAVSSEPVQLSSPVASQQFETYSEEKLSLDHEEFFGGYRVEMDGNGTGRGQDELFVHDKDDDYNFRGLEDMNSEVDRVGEHNWDKVDEDESEEDADDEIDDEIEVEMPYVMEEGYDNEEQEEIKFCEHDEEEGRSVEGDSEEEGEEVEESDIEQHDHQPGGQQPGATQDDAIELSD